jgi:hypothetical protein
MRRLAVILLVLASCERTKAPDGVQLPLPKVTVKLVDPGAEPRVELRSHPHEGAKQTFLLTRTVIVQVGDREVKQTMAMTYDVELIAVEHDEIHSRMTIRSMSVDPASKTFDPSVQIGSTEDSWRDARGVQVRPSLLRTREDPKSMSSRPEMLAIAPQEAVGVGAHWHEDIENGAAHASVDAELLSNDGHKVRERLTYSSDRGVQGVGSTYTGTTTIEFALEELDGSGDGSNSFTFRRDGRDFAGTETLSIRPAGTK